MPGSVSAKPAARSPLTSSIIPRATMACTRSTIRRGRISRGWRRPTMTTRQGGGAADAPLRAPREGDLESPDDAHAIVRMEAVGGGGIVLAQPPVQHRRALGAPHGLELPPEARDGRRRRVQAPEEGP